MQHGIVCRVVCSVWSTIQCAVCSIIVCSEQSTVCNMLRVYRVCSIYAPWFSMQRVLCTIYYAVPTSVQRVQCIQQGIQCLCSMMGVLFTVLKEIIRTAGLPTWQCLHHSYVYTAVEYTGCKHLCSVQYTMSCGMLQHVVCIMQSAVCSSVHAVVCIMYTSVGVG